FAGEEETGLPRRDLQEQYIAGEIGPFGEYDELNWYLKRTGIKYDELFRELSEGGFLKKGDVMSPEAIRRAANK
ncbi:MAG: hypothetical protein ACWGQW_15715, partial [bacterium]